MLEIFLCAIILCSDLAIFYCVRFVQPTFLDLFIKSVLNAREKPTKDLSVAFRPLFGHMLHDDLQSIVVPSSVKMLKRNPEIVLDSVAFCLESVTLDLSKYAIEILSVVSPQARHTDENRRTGALAIVRCLSQKSSNPDTLEAMFNNVKAVIGGLALCFLLILFFSIG